MTTAQLRETGSEIVPPAPRRRLGWRLPKPDAPARVGRFEPGKAGEARKRNPLWLAGGLLLVLVCALAGALLFASTDERVAVLVAADDLSPGMPVSHDSFEVAQVAAEANVSSLDPSMVDSVVGRMPSGPIPKGTLISDGLLVDAIPLKPNEMIIGVALDPGEAPSNSVDVGAYVDLLVISKAAPTGGGTEASTARSVGTGVVWGAQRLDSGQVVLSIRAERVVGLAAAAASTDDRLRVALVGSGQ